MARTSESGRRHGEVRPEWKELLGEVGRVPVKLSAERSADARAILQRDGAVVVRDQGGDPERLVTAAAETLGGRLRELFGIRPQGGVDAPPLGLHSDGATDVVDVHGRSTRLRDPDEDFLLMLCSGPAPEGGDSVLVDGYALLDALRTGLPELHAFLTGTDVDYFGVHHGRALTDRPRAISPG